MILQYLAYNFRAGGKSSESFLFLTLCQFSDTLKVHLEAKNKRWLDPGRGTDCLAFDAYRSFVSWLEPDNAHLKILLNQIP